MWCIICGNIVKHVSTEHKLYQCTTKGCHLNKPRKPNKVWIVFRNELAYKTHGENSLLWWR